MTVLRASSLFAAGMCVAYLMLPFAHYLFGTPPGCRSITTAANFFAFSPALQAAGRLVAEPAHAEP